MPYLALLDLVWSLAAFLYDFPAIREIPPWALPFVVICPIYPLLLASVWLSFWRRFRLPSFVIALATLPSATYGLLSLLYYPLLMQQTGFTWNALLQIPWVLLYGIQGLYLLKTRAIRYIWACLSANLFLIASFLIQYQHKAFDYLDFASLTPTSLHFLLLIAIGLSLSLSIWTLYPLIQPHEKR